jgi:hypothetical protein
MEILEGLEVVSSPLSRVRVWSSVVLEKVKYAAQLSGGRLGSGGARSKAPFNNFLGPVLEYRYGRPILLPARYRQFK